METFRTLFSDMTPCSLVHRHNPQTMRSAVLGEGGVSGAVRVTADNRWDCHW